MKNSSLFLALVVWAGSPLLVSAQTPAQPADPNQALPAQPVQPAPAPSSVPLGTVPTTPTSPVAPGVAVIADSSLKAVIQELAQTWADSQDSNPQVPITLTNAGTMRAKIEAGAVWDVVVSADINDIKAMTDKGLLLAAGERSVARNSLALIGRTPLVKDDDLDWFDLIGTEWKKVALGNPALVSSGRVAKLALQKHDLAGDDHKDVYVYAPNEVAALQIGQKQQADAVFVYKTDLANMRVPGFDVFPLKTEDAPPIFYTVAIFRLAKNPILARAFIDYCVSEPARAVWIKYGFETN